MRVPHVAGPPMAPAAQEGRQAMGKRGVAGVVQAPLPLPALPQGVHGARPGLWAQETYHQQAQEDGGQTGKRSYGEGGSAGGGGGRRAGGGGEGGGGGGGGGRGGGGRPPPSSPPPPPSPPFYWDWMASVCDVRGACGR